MESHIGWDAERVELKAELSRLEEELAESRAETEELRSRSNVLSERLSQTLDSSISLHWDSEQREWRKKLKEGRERESRQALLIQKLQQKVKEYRSRCEHLQHHLMAEEREMRVRERILQDERSDNLETTLIRLEEEQQRSVTLVEVNALLRSQLSQSAEANQALQDDLKKLTADWSKAVEEAGQKEIDWSKEKEVLSRYLESERSRLMSLWSRVVDLRRQCHAVKTATDKDLWELKAEFTRLSSTFLSLSVRPALSPHPPPPPPQPPPPPPPPLYTSGPMTLAELDHDVNTEKLKSRIDELTAIIKSQELVRQREEEAMKNSIRKEEMEQELQQEKYREMERQLEYVTQALIKLYRSLGSQRSNGHKRIFPDLAVFSDDLHSILWVISEIESAFQWEHKELQAAERKSEGLRMETESLQQQISEFKNEKVDLQKQASLMAVELKQTQSLLNSEKETALSLKRQLDESEHRGEELKKSNVRLIQQRERADEERNELERERQRRMEAELVENARLCEQQSHARIELHTLKVVLEQEREGKAIAEKELADTRDALAKARESLLSLSSTHTMLQRENSDTSDALEKMATLNESLTRDKRELSARSLQLEEEVTECQLQLQHLKSDVASLQKELNAVSEENTELRALQNADLDSLHLLRVREREIEGELQILREERERESNALSDEKRKNEQLSEQYSSVCVELHDVKVRLDKEMDQEKRAQREREELQREKQRLEEQVHKIGQEKEEIKQDQEDLRNLSGNLQQQLCVAKEQISVHKVQHTQLQMQVHTLQQAKDVLHGEIKCLQSELQQNSFLREEERRGASEQHMWHEKEINNCQLEIRRLNAEAQASLNNNRKHEEDREKWQREREALNSELGLKDGEMGALKNRMDGLVKENEKLAALIGEKDGDMLRLLSEIRSLELQMPEVKAEMEHWRERVIDIEREKDGLLERVKQECENLKIREKENAGMADILKMRDVEIEKNSKHIEELIDNLRLQDILVEKLKKELKEKDFGMSALINKEKIKQTEREVEEREKELKLKGEIKKKENELERLKDNVEELKVERQHMSHLLQEKDAYLEKLKNKVIDLEQTDRETQDKMECWKKKAGDVEREKEVLKERVENHISVEQEINELADRLRIRDKEIKKLKTNEQDMVSDIEKMKEEQREQEKELKQRDREVEELGTTIVNLIKEKNEQEKWKMQLEELKKEKTSLEETTNQLEERVQNMKEEITVLRVRVGELDSEKKEVDRKVLEQRDQLQIQTVLLKDREVALDKLRETLEQKEQQENEELVTLKEKLKKTELVQERNIQKEFQKVQLARDTLEQVEGKVKELETKNKNLTQEADMVRKNLVEQLRELERKSKLLLEYEENFNRLKLRVESGEDEKEQLKRSLKELVELREREQEEEQLRLVLEQQILDLGEDLKRKNGVIDALKEKTDLIIKQKEEELKVAKKNKDAMSTELTKLREELTVLSVSKEKAETMVKELNIENKKIKDGLKVGLEEMVTLKELLEESHCEGEKLRKILEEKKNEMIKGRKEEVRAAREETEHLKLRVQILQKENQDLQAQLWIREKNDIKMNWEVKEIKKMELEMHETLKTLEEEVKDKNGQLEKHEASMKYEKNKRQSQLKDNSFELREKLKQEESEINTKNIMEEQEITVLRSKTEKKKTSFELVKDELGQKRETGANEKIKHIEPESDKTVVFAIDILPKGETGLKITPEFKEENTRHLLGELNDAKMDTNLEKNILLEKTHCHFQENFTIVNADTKRDFQMKELLSQTEMTENTELQAEVYDLKNETDELKKDRDRFRKALEKNEAILIHYQEKAHQLEKKVQMMIGCEEESKERVYTMQKAVAELELKLIKLQQRNQRLEHRIEKLRLEKMNLRDTLKQVELEREKLRCQLSQSSAEMQDLYISRNLKQAVKIVADPSHPGCNIFDALPSGRRLRSIMTKTTTISSTYYGLLSTSLDINVQPPFAVFICITLTHTTAMLHKNTRQPYCTSYLPTSNCEHLH
ncbi:centrosome-associated protein CEP250 isoform X1 [Hemibagrus wyckioides]|uniref:centrosome-associated protein CEP250 isoform X1 n=1 Tax=Hemibagrus wyckioides TaxID=337641 RepID=UPI00266CC23D|nr:centrosome-associated protein CEP250 isoform X1 [Hemibagrus wyckioides]XP_058248636.1 centrosome-associated protein CEP250 isoform X1 [Hemibagrus wyckioides]XP_058248637.1 centrosome-associated protein CEP250 isoform X1 [Hemibagrus wyckioides]XP_058248638.1 centrosome-associated protein CEP250 isoform X1 [Hemibagrus wyckioides]